MLRMVENTPPMRAAIDLTALQRAIIFAFVITSLMLRWLNHAAHG